PGPQTSVPLTWVTAPGVPIALPPARTSPLTSNATKPLSSWTKTSPSRVDQGCPPPVIPPTTLPACSMPMIVLHTTMLSARLGDAIAARRTATSAAVPSVFMVPLRRCISAGARAFERHSPLFRIGSGKVFILHVWPNDATGCQTLKLNCDDPQVRLE